MEMIAPLKKLIESLEARSKPENDLPVFAGVTLVLALTGFVWFIWKAAQVTQPWHYLPLVALVAVCLDLGLPFGQRRWRAPLLGLAIATAIIAIPTGYRDLKWRFTTVDLAAAKLKTSAMSEDFVIVTPWYAGISFNRYYQAQAPWTTLPTLTNHTIHLATGVLDQMEKPHAMQPILEKISATLQAGHRVWVVGWMDVPPAGVPMPADLPPPPLKYAGWSYMPYALRWNAQVAQFLSNHSQQFSRLPLPIKGSANFNEDLGLFIATGWQNSNNFPARTPTP